MREKNIVVIGQGYVGLPLAVRAVEAGHTVTGLDVDERRAAALAAGVSYVEDIDSERLGAIGATGRYTVASDYADLPEWDIAVVTVPTPLRDARPDLRFVEDACRALASSLRRGCLVVLESTTYPGTTEELVVPILEKASGLRAGAEFLVGYSPERIDPGNAQWNLVNTPKVVSGVDARSSAAVQDFYATLVDTVVPVSGTREAELTKLLENTFRHVNIALVNELAVFADELGIDVWETIRAASTKPFGFMPFAPGPGVGGHCLPVDPSYLSWQVRRKLGRTFRFIELANDVNEHMPDHVVRKVVSMLNDGGRAVRGSRIALVGLAYKKNSGDVRESPSVRVIELLRDLGAEVVGVDPHVEEHLWPDFIARRPPRTESFEDCDLAVLLTNHDDVDAEMLRGVPTFDTRHALAPAPMVRSL
ncbi:nucleotide sugar dehydrogenase [Curtobacterium sp. MCSS17_015]|uniref:nucleotide sugar dehydrogenase n=1 Tax=Curtobacterium sp. MCSS17_015 TaxID=2175666 RepID=UPI000DAA9C65|nr:nucleotide sugar dehydrogenase [Curtobacterium sp. MCSS17_015]WIB26928.1 nucleotide sugar dehydrogenase [Curtobacterium sp. MCSS17_015]